MSVTPAEVAVALGRPTPAEGTPQYGQWARWITGARMLIRNRLGDLDLLDQETLDYVVCEAVLPLARRDGDTSSQVEIAIDDGRVSRTYVAGAGTVVISDDWWDLLTGGGASSASAYSARPSFVRDHCP